MALSSLPSGLGVTWELVPLSLDVWLLAVQVGKDVPFTLWSPVSRYHVGCHGLTSWTQGTLSLRSPGTTCQVLDLVD